MPASLRCCDDFMAIRSRPRISSSLTFRLTKLEVRSLTRWLRTQTGPKLRRRLKIFSPLLTFFRFLRPKQQKLSEQNRCRQTRRQLHLRHFSRCQTEQRFQNLVPPVASKISTISIEPMGPLCMASCLPGCPETKFQTFCRRYSSQHLRISAH